jgi:hypothetical protein
MTATLGCIDSRYGTSGDIPAIFDENDEDLIRIIIKKRAY